jgi:hypothetical protein
MSLPTDSGSGGGGGGGGGGIGDDGIGPLHSPRLQTLIQPHSPSSPGRRKRGWTLTKKRRDSEDSDANQQHIMSRLSPMSSLDEQEARKASSTRTASPREPSSSEMSRSCSPHEDEVAAVDEERERVKKSHRSHKNDTVCSSAKTIDRLCRLYRLYRRLRVYVALCGPGRYGVDCLVD